MASYNRVVLLGNVTRDLELRYLPSGMAVVDLGLAVNDRRKTADGQWVDEPTFVDITLFGRTAEIAGEYLSKGAPTLIEGRLKLDSWEGQDGQKRSKLKVIGDRLVLLGTKGGGGAAGGAGSAGSGARAPARAASQNNQYSQPAPPEDDFGPPPEAGPAGGGGGGGGADIPF